MYAALQNHAVTRLVKEARGFRYLWLSNFLFFTGNWMQILIMSWLAYDLTKSTWLLALFTTIRVLPMLLAPFGGLLADRINRVHFLFFACLLAATSSLVLGVLSALGQAQFWQLAVVGFVLGMTHFALQPARYALIVDIVDKQKVSTAVSLSSIAIESTWVIGPLLGGLLLGWLEPQIALWIATVWFLLAAMVVLLVKAPNQSSPRPSRGSPLKELYTGLSLALRSGDVRWVLSVSLLANICVWPVFQAFLPVFAKDILHSGPSGLGLLMTSMGIGAVLGALFIAALGDFRWKGLLFALGTAAYGLFFALFALSRWFPLSFVLIAGVGVGSSAFMSMQAALVLLLAPKEIHGRVMGLQQFVIGILPLGILIQGAVAGVIGVPTTTMVFGSLLAVYCLALLVFVPRFRHLS